MRIICMTWNASKVITENYAHYGKTCYKNVRSEIIVLLILSP